MSKATGLADIVTTWGTSTDTSPRPTRLPGVENDVKAKLEAVDTLLGSGVQGAFADVASRLAAITTGATYYKQPVRVAATANVTLSGTQTIDGVAVIVGDRVLVTAQSTGSQNGVYVVASGAWTRATDFDAGSEFPGATLLVLEGTAGNGNEYAVTNASNPTIGTTTVGFRKQTRSGSEYYVSASDNPIAARNADFVCDGTSDDAEVTLALFFIASSTFKRATVKLSGGTFNFAGAVTPPTGCSIVGAGSNATVIVRTTDAIAFDFTGSYTGGGSTAGHKHSCTVSDLRIQSSVSPHLSPMVRIQYGNNHRLQRVDFDSGQSIALLGLEWQDSVVEQCRFLATGSKGAGPRTFGTTGTGAGGRPGVLLLGDTQSSGSGHTDLGCANVRFRACTWVDHTDTAFQSHGNSAAEDFGGQVAVRNNGIWLTDCQVRSNATGYAPQVKLYKTDAIWVRDFRLTVGNWLNVSGSAQIEFDVDACNGVKIGGFWFDVVAGSTNTHSSIIRFNGCEAVDCDPIRGDWLSTVAPTTAVIGLGGNNIQCVQEFKVFVRQRGVSLPTLVQASFGITSMRMRGTTTIAVGNTTSVVTHLLPRTPVAGDIRWAVIATAGNAVPSNNVGIINVDTYTATTFTLRCQTAPATNVLTVEWWSDLIGDQGHT